jgi:transposase-like protein
MAKRRNFTDQFKAKVALEALRGDKTVQEIAAKHQLHPNQVSAWKRQACAFRGYPVSDSDNTRSLIPI